MKLAVISDIHDNIHNLHIALELIKKEKCDKIICLGDFINPGIVKILAYFDIPTHAIWGNNDGDKVTIMRIVLSKKSHLTMSTETFDTIEIDNKHLFLTHNPLLAKPMAKSGDFDAVFYGHNHEKNIENIGKCLLLNPGEISAHKTDKATLAFYNTKTNEAEIIILKGTISVRN
ncbi:MAG: metallophosphoesterase [Candidatus Woesearchaeota archaeon]|jgi:hypothetical protein